MIRYAFLLLLVGCAPPPPTAPGLQVATPITTVDAAALCETAANEQDWLLTIDALETLQGMGQTCAGPKTISERLYEAHVRHAEQLTSQGREQEARRAYEQALQYTPTDPRARNALTPDSIASTLETCAEDTIRAAYSNMPAYAPANADFVTLAANSTISLRGVIYEPKDAPGARFLAEAAPEAVDQELFLIAEAGFKLIRIYLHHDVLFQCPGSGVVPVPAAFERLDYVMQAAAARNLRVITVLNHNPDLSTHPLYDSPPHTIEQTRFLVQRYHDEPTLVAWDVRDSGDIDYTSGPFEREQVLQWLTKITQLIRQEAPNHLITAGWNSDAAATAPLVDFVSFQHYGALDDLRQEIALLRSQTNKPLFLAGVGYPMVNGDEIGQRDNLYNALLAVENNGLLGWAVYSAFDHPRTVCADCERFGLWNMTYFPKFALDAPRSVIND